VRPVRAAPRMQGIGAHSANSRRAQRPALPAIAHPRGHLAPAVSATSGEGYARAVDQPAASNGDGSKGDRVDLNQQSPLLPTTATFVDANVVDDVPTGHDP
jgi:hypothetical protein